MPFYVWKDKNTELEVEVLRSHSEYENPPTQEEAAVLSDEEYDAANWERLIRDVKSVGFGLKGHWIIPFIIGGLDVLSRL